MVLKFLNVSVLVLFWGLAAGKNPTFIRALRFWPAPNSLRLVFEIDKPIKYIIKYPKSDQALFTCIDAKFTLRNNIQISSHLLKNIQIINNVKYATIALDFADLVIMKHFILPPNDRYGYRLVIDLDSKEKADILALFTKEVEQLPIKQAQRYIVAIDAGHGGEDPGAIGPRGTYEKTIVLKVAQLLAQELQRCNHITPILIRTGDYYVGLRERVLKARSNRADLFISLHADAAPNKRSLASGASVYVLSSSGASSAAARLLADRENKSDLIGGLQLVKYPTIAKTLLDLSQTANKKSSVAVANHVLHSLNNVTTLHTPHVDQAGFMVLKAPDVPSVLVEIGFISHSTQELKLRSLMHQTALAHAIASGVQKYLRAHHEVR